MAEKAVSRKRKLLTLTGRTVFGESVLAFVLGKNRLNRKDALWAYVFTTPWLIGFLLLTIGPIIISSVMSFYNWHGFGVPRFVGLHNYRWIFTHDDLFRKSLSVTFTFVGTAIPLKIIVSFAVALMLSKKLFGVTVLRSMYYLPSVVTGVAVAFMWLYIFDPVNGPVNLFLQSVLKLKKPIAWLAAPEWVLPSFIVMNIWTLGSTMVILLAGIKGIPRSLYESALIDGANAWRRTWAITIPMVSPSLFYVLVIGTISAFQVLTAPLVIFGSYTPEEIGGPMYSGLFYSLYLYKKAFVEGRMGYACTLAWILFVIILSLTAINFFVLGRRVYYEK